MNTFTKGVLVGIGIGLLVAPMSGKETRRVLVERAQAWRDALPEDSRMNQYLSQASDQVASMKENVRDSTQQAVSKAKEASTALGNKAIQAGQDLASRAKETGQEMASRVMQTAGLASSSPDGANTRVTPEPED